MARGRNEWAVGLAGPWCSPWVASRSCRVSRRDKDSDGFLCPGCGVLVPVGCPCPLPFGARPMPVPATLRCPPHARARYPSVPAQLLVPRRAPTRRLPLLAVCSYSSNYSFLGVLLLVGYPYPLCAPTRSLPAPARCPCLPTARARGVPVPLLLRLLGRALAPAPPRDLARAPWRAARARPHSKKAKSY